MGRAGGERRVRRTVRVLAWGGVAAVLVLLAVGGNSLAHYRGWSVHRMEPAALSAKLAPLLPDRQAGGRGAASRPRYSTPAATGRTTTSTAGQRC